MFEVHLGKRGFDVYPVFLGWRKSK